MAPRCHIDRATEPVAWHFHSTRSAPTGYADWTTGRTTLAEKKAWTAEGAEKDRRDRRERLHHSKLADGASLE